MYKEKRLSLSEFVPIRGLRYHVQRWEQTDASATAASAGPPQARPAPQPKDRGSEPPKAHAVTSVGANNLPPLVLMHGWMDVAASYQFMVDAFTDAFMHGRTIIAADWRGFGKTASGPGDGVVDNFWYADYLADLDCLLDALVPGQSVDLVGHSMGGNVVMLYAGVRPTRIRRLVNLEGFGMPATQALDAPERYATWMDQLKKLRSGEMDLRPYDDISGVARRLMRTNPRLSLDKANWLAQQWAAPKVQADGATKWEILGDPAHKIVNAHLYQLEETLAIWRRITAPTLCVDASDNEMEKWYAGRYTLADYYQRLTAVPSLQKAHINDAGHMLHHDQPDALAALIEGFLN